MAKSLTIRTCSEICIAADHADHWDQLKELWLEVVGNKKRYPLTELSYIREHLQERSRQLYIQLFREIRKDFALLNQ